jgi:hypothetical protein
VALPPDEVSIADAARALPYELLTIVVVPSDVSPTLEVVARMARLRLAAGSNGRLVQFEAPPAVWDLVHFCGFTQALVPSRASSPTH